jgi:hypothetical protein
MLRHLFCIIIFAFIGAALPAQSNLFVPRNYLKSYENGTRSWDGKPGAKYWQNKAKYVITARLEPKTRLLSGEESVTYFNNSPDTLKSIRIKLQHNRYQTGAARAFEVTPSDVSDEGVSIQYIGWNGQKIDKKDQRDAQTFLDISLADKPLTPGSNAVLAVKWSYTLPAG